MYGIGDRMINAPRRVRHHVGRLQVGVQAAAVDPARTSSPDSADVLCSVDSVPGGVVGALGGVWGVGSVAIPFVAREVAAGEGAGVHCPRLG
jgi:hypothetical protein